MSLEIGDITVATATSITGTGLAKALFDARKAGLDASMNSADASMASRPRQPDPAKVQTFIRGEPPFLSRTPPDTAAFQTAMTAVATYAGNPSATPPVPSSWPESLLMPAPQPIDRAAAYRALAAQCKADATGIVPYLQANAEIGAGTMTAGGDAVTGVGTLG